jgi:hypothetical protein
VADLPPSTDPPSGHVYRIARGPNPFALTDWKWAAGGVRFGGRWDDPNGSLGVPIDQRYRVTYVASTEEGAYGEMIGQWQNQGEPPKNWETPHLVGEATLSTSLPFADLTSKEVTDLLAGLPSVRTTVQEMNDLIVMVSKAAKLPIAQLQIDDFLVTSIFRPVTQVISRYIYDVEDTNKAPVFAGIRYASHYPPRWECWAVYENRARITLVSASAIDKNNPQLQRAATALHMEVR